MTDPSPERLKRVAEWCGFEWVSRILTLTVDDPGIERVVSVENEDGHGGWFVPHKRYAPAWQWQAIYEALEDEGIMEAYFTNLYHSVEAPIEDVIASAITATPAQRYRALRRTLREHGILPDEGEGSDD